ncbi:MAG: hypothetical protein L6Q57_00875 [Alphaproteobacteria bacterium]|nr:hypothetical protein [Alphaproteobacteria bacterium]
MSAKLIHRTHASRTGVFVDRDAKQQLLESVPARGAVVDLGPQFYSTDAMEPASPNELTSDRWDKTTIRRSEDPVDTQELIAEFERMASPEVESNPDDQPTLHEAYAVELVVQNARPKRLDIDAAPETALDRDGEEVFVSPGAKLVLVAA